MKVKLGEIVEQIRGVSYKPEDLRDNLDVNSVILLRANNIQDGKIVLDDLVYVSKDKVNEIQYLKKGDILVCASSGSKDLVGKAAFVDKNILMVFGAFCKVVRPKAEYSKYIGHFFQSPYYRKTISAVSAGANINNLRNEHIADLLINIPELDEQHHIAAVLDKVSDLIALRKKQLAKLDELVKARFVEMFGDIKEMVPLSYYIRELIAGKSLAGEEWSNNKVLKTSAVTYDYFDSSQVKSLPREYKPLKKNKVKVGDVIISRMNTPELVGASAYVWDVLEDTYLPDRLWRAEISDFASSVFVWQLLIQDTSKDDIKRVATVTSGSMKNISKKSLLKINVKKVDLKDQEEFSLFCKKTNKFKLILHQSLEKLEILKKSLMQEYFG